MVMVAAAAASSSSCSCNNNNNNNNNLICIAPACRMTSEALADSSSRATECLTEKYCFKSAFKSTNRATE